MGKKYYAVKAGRQTGIFQAWDKCKAQVTGFPNAQFKGFDTLQEAESYLGASAGTSPAPANQADTFTPPTATDEAAAYVDGSFDVKTNTFSFGVVLFHNGRTLQFAGADQDAHLSSMRNVAGEIKGAQHAMAYCVEQGISRLHLYYDYAGIEHWCTGGWKCNKTGTMAYKAYYDSIKDKLTVVFHKVAGHSGDTYNDLADALAKGALGISGGVKPQEEILP